MDHLLSKETRFTEGKTLLNRKILKSYIVLRELVLSEEIFEN